MNLLKKKSCLIVALRNEKGSYNQSVFQNLHDCIVALRNEKGSYNVSDLAKKVKKIVALRNEKGSYNPVCGIFRIV